MAAGRNVLAIVGPTSTGKSTLAQRLAEKLNGEIVSADSRQVYRHMDIGTAKPSSEQRAAVPHHLIDVVDPDEVFSLALFLRQAREAIRDILSRSRLPIVAGGTGQYVWGLLEGWQVPEAPPDPALRGALEERARAEGAASLHRELARVDPSAAHRIDARNVRRVIRALEIFYTFSEPRSLQPSRTRPSFQHAIVGLTLDRTALYERVNGRVDAMMEAGWVAEVEGLLGRRYGPELASMSSLGYREIAQHLRGEMPLEVARTEIKQRTRRFARQQYAWFKLDDERIRWFQGTSEGIDEASSRIGAFLAGKGDAN